MYFIIRKQLWYSSWYTEDTGKSLVKKIPYCETLVGLLWVKIFFLQEIVFSQLILAEIEAGWFSQEVRCSGARDILRNGALHRTICCPIEHFDLLRYCKYLPVSSLKIKNSVINFLESKQIPQRNTSVSHESL